MSMWESSRGDLSVGMEGELSFSENPERSMVVRFSEPPTRHSLSSSFVGRSRRQGRNIGGRGRVSMSADVSLYRGLDDSLARKTFSASAQTDKCLAKVRWLQDKETLIVPDPSATEYFVSASYSAGQSANDVSLWRLEVDGNDDEGILTARPHLVSQDYLIEDTTDMVVTEAGSVVITTAEGSLQFYSCDTNETGDLTSIKSRTSIKNTHSYSGSSVPATGVDCYGSSVVSVGEDGSIVEYALGSHSINVKSRWNSVDSLSMHCVKYVGSSQILTGNGAGQLKLWDLRADSSPLVQTMNATNNLYGAITIAQHPSQNHLVVVGYQSGTVDLWDLRKGSGCDPVVNLSADESALNEIYFHQVNPDHFFSCSENGQVRHWYPSDNDPEFLEGIPDQGNELNIEFLKRELVFSDIHAASLPINSISLSKNDRIVSGGDSGILHITTVSTSN